MFKPVILFGKAVRSISRLRGGGSALPGLVVEKIDPNFMQRTLSQLPKGVVLISGTNGKTTTTKIVTELLESQGLKVFTNSSGSNFTRGVAASLLGAIDLQGNLDADIAVLELDEAHAVHFVSAVPPKFCLILNVMRDQLDRFGEIDTTANLLLQIALATTDKVVLNREDPRLREIANQLNAQNVAYFGLVPDLRPLFPNDDEIHAKATKKTKYPEANVVLKSFKAQQAAFYIDKRVISTKLQLAGIYNIYNAVAALALVKAVVDNIDEKKLVKQLAAVEPAFGRGETLYVDGQPLELVLVKNPSGFRLGLQSFNPKLYATMIAINDDYADGRDMSWLWDVNFDSLKQGGVAMVSGARAYDMALRLQYDNVPLVQVTDDLRGALHAFIKKHNARPKRIYCTYTAMLALRRELRKITTVEHIT